MADTLSEQNLAAGIEEEAAKPRERAEPRMRVVQVKRERGGAPLSIFLVAAIILIALYLYRASKAKGSSLLPNINVFPARAPAGYPQQAAPQAQEPAPGEVPGTVPAPVLKVVPRAPAPFTPAPVSAPELAPLPGPAGANVLSPGGQ